MEQPTQALNELHDVLKIMQQLKVPPIVPDLFGTVEELHYQEREAAKDIIDLVEAKHELCTDLNSVLVHGGLIDIISVVREIKRLNNEAEYMIIHLSLNDRMQEFKAAALDARSAFNTFIEAMSDQDVNIEYIMPGEPPCRHGDESCDCVIN